MSEQYRGTAVLERPQEDLELLREPVEARDRGIAKRAFVLEQLDSDAQGEDKPVSLLDRGIVRAKAAAQRKDTFNSKL